MEGSVMWKYDYSNQTRLNGLVKSLLIKYSTLTSAFYGNDAMFWSDTSISGSKTCGMLW
jgi:hypothetical protein